jgi:S-DNA-T family DNA segregation ATPase FtsK/SpoIIIE
MIEYAIIGGYAVYKLWEKHKTIWLKMKWKNIMEHINKDDRANYELLKVIETQYGFNCLVSIPLGSSYAKFEKILPAIEAGIGCIVEAEWKRFDHCIDLKMATVDYDNSKPFKPVQTKEYELYCGETFFLESLMPDMRDYPHILTAGSTGTGKSRCIFIILTNLLYGHDNVDVFLAQVSDKKDLEKFCHYKQTKYFAKNLQTTYQLLTYLLQIQRSRNKELNRYHLNNIGEYNTKFPDKKYNYTYLFIDEFSRLMPGENENIDQYFPLKKKIIFTLNELLTQSRSAGIFFITSLQRPDRANLDPNIKNLLNIKIAFRANNIASSKVLTDDDSAWNLPNREALFIGSYQKTLKTPYIDDNIIKTLLKDKLEHDHKYVNIHPEPISIPTTDTKTDKVKDISREKKKRRQFKV